MNETNVLGFFNVEPRASIRGAEMSVGVSYASCQRILKRRKMHNFKFTKCQALEIGDYARRIAFCQTMLEKLREEPSFLNQIIWSDEAKFSNDGLVNSRNNHYWSDENPHLITERNHQYKFSFNVFCLLMNNKIAYVMYDENLNSVKYLQILNTTVSDVLDELPLNQQFTCWYQLDGAPAHCSNEVTAKLQNLFDDRWIRRNGPWEWPPRSPDLTPLDFYLWGKIKSKVYQSQVHSKEELQRRVENAMANISPAEIKKATTAVLTRVKKCMNAEGRHFEHLL